MLEGFTVPLSSYKNIDEARKQLINKKGWATDANFSYQSSISSYNILNELYFKDCKMLQSWQNLPSLELWGWTDVNNWKPLWTILPEARGPSRELHWAVDWARPIFAFFFHLFFFPAIFFFAYLFSQSFAHNLTIFLIIMHFFLVYLQLLSMHDCCIRVIHNTVTALLEYLDLSTVFLCTG